jgi:hypothetical protein
MKADNGLYMRELEHNPIGSTSEIYSQVCRNLFTTSQHKGTVIPAKAGTSSRNRDIWRQHLLAVRKCLGDPGLRRDDGF